MIDFSIPAYARLRDDYSWFVREVFRLSGLASKAPIGEPEIEMCNWIQHGPDDLILIAPRGIGKSHLVSICYPLWEWYRDPQTRIVEVSKSGEQVEWLIGQARNLINVVPFLRHLAPRRDLKQDDNTTTFEVGPSIKGVQPSMWATGIGGQLPGKRADIILLDDIETDQNTLTAESRDRLFNKAVNVRALLYKPTLNDHKRRRIIGVGTYWHEQSVYLRLNAPDHDGNPGVPIRTIPLCYPTPAERKVIVGLSPRMERLLDTGKARPGDSAFPHRIDEKAIAKEKKAGPRYWAMSVMCLTNLGNSSIYPVRLDDLMVMDVDPLKAPISVTWGERDHSGDTAVDSIPRLGVRGEPLRRPAMIDKDWAAYQESVAYIDIAGLGDDELSYCCIGQLAGYFHVKLWRGIHVRDFIAGAGRDNVADGAITASLAAVFKDIRRMRATRIGWECNVDSTTAYQATLEVNLPRFYLEPGQDPAFPTGWKASLEKRRSHGRKTDRILDTIETVIGSHRLVVDKQALIPDGKPGMYQAQFQLSRVRREVGCLAHDDRLDSLEGALHMLLEAARIDPTVAADRVRTRQREQQHSKVVHLCEALNEFENRNTPPPRWRY